MSDCEIPNGLLSARELAAKIRVTEGTVRHWARTDRIPCHRLGDKVIRFNFEQVYRAMIDDPRRRNRRRAV